MTHWTVWYRPEGVAVPVAISFSTFEAACGYAKWLTTWRIIGKPRLARRSW
jgi:hypothetical protein